MNDTTQPAKVTIADFEIIDSGIDHAQYFQGVGTAFTRYNHCAVGCGTTPAESIEDALESVAMEDGNIDFSAIEADETYLALAAEQRDIYELLGESEETTDEDRESDERYYYTAIRYNLPSEQVGADTDSDS